MTEISDCIPCNFTYDESNTNWHIDWPKNRSGLHFKISIDGVDVSGHAFAALAGASGWVDVYMTRGVFPPRRYPAQCGIHEASERLIGFVVMKSYRI